MPNPMDITCFAVAQLFVLSCNSSCLGSSIQWGHFDYQIDCDAVETASKCVAGYLVSLFARLSPYAITGGLRFITGGLFVFNKLGSAPFVQTSCGSTQPHSNKSGNTACFAEVVILRDSNTSSCTKMDLLEGRG